eukprot:Em0001g2690a
MADENDLMLRAASRLGNFEKVKELINSGAHPESCDGSGKTALHYASENGNFEIVMHIISVQRATINQVDNLGCDALHWASKQGKHDVVETLMQKGADIHHCDKDGSTALHAAATGGHEDTVKSLLRHGIKPSVQNNFGKTAMYYAETFGHLKVANILSDSSKIDDSVPTISTPYDNLLQNACYFGNLKSVKQWVDFANPDYTDLVGNTCLHIAAEQGHKDVVAVLLSKNFQVDHPDKFGRTALQLAVQKGNISMFDLLLSHGANIHHCTLKNRTVLHYAAIGGFRLLVEKILSQNVNLDALLFTKDTFGRSPFDYATCFQQADVAQILNDKMKTFATRSHEQMIGHSNLYETSTKIPSGASQDELGSLFRNAARYSENESNLQLILQLLEAGTSVNLKDVKGNTPLHIAAENGCDKIVSLLISRGASVNLPDEAGYTALSWAAKQGHSSTATLLLKNGADIENTDKEDGYTALHIAAIGGHSAMVKILLAHRADLYTKDKYGRTAQENAKLHNRTEVQDLLESAKDEDNCRLRTACYYGHLEMVKRCIAKAQTDSTDFAGNSALHLIAQNKKDLVDIVGILLAQGFSIHKTDKLKRSALHLASRSGNSQIVTFLLSKGAEVNSLTEKNRSALHYAAMGGYIEIATTLLHHGIDINMKDQYGNTAQMYAAKFSKHDMDVFLSRKTEQKISTVLNEKSRYTITPDDLIEALPAEHFCPITDELLLNPYLSDCCGKHFSQEVVKKSNGKCPYCRHNNPTFVLNKDQKRKFLSLKVKCRFKSRGCSWTGEGFDFVNHLEKNCQFVDAVFDCGNFDYNIPDDLKKGCCDVYSIHLDENGYTDTNDCHGFSITFPSGILLSNQTITLTIGVMLYGPFLFPDNVVPVSPILWVCGDSSDVKLLKNAKIEGSDLDFWKFDFETLELKEEEELYPPRFVLQVRPTGVVTYRNVLVTFSGVSTQIEIALPLQGQQHPIDETPKKQTLMDTTEKSGSSSKCELKDLLNDVVSIIPNKWKLVGIQLNLSLATLESIQTDNAGKPNACLDSFLQVFSAWEKQESGASRELLLSKMISLSFICFWTSSLVGSILEIPILINRLTWLKRKLAELGLKRRGQLETPLQQLVEAIKIELKTSNCLLGYRAMWRLLHTKYGYIAKRSTIMMLLAVMDPDGVKLRKKHCLRRRTYINKGPNWCWHMDGYDKLKPYGFPIHACIDGIKDLLYTMNVVGVVASNVLVVVSFNMLGVVASNVLGLVSSNVLGCPTRIRADCGSENVSIAACQMLLRHQHHDCYAGSNSFVFGSSIRNTGLVEEGLYDTSIELHKHLASYVFGGVLARELDEFKSRWNNHRIRRNRLASCPCDVPNDLYHLVGNMGGDYIQDIDVNHTLDATTPSTLDYTTLSTLDDTTTSTLDDTTPSTLDDTRPSTLDATTPSILNDTTTSTLDATTPTTFMVYSKSLMLIWQPQVSGLDHPIHKNK